MLNTRGLLKALGVVFMAALVAGAQSSPNQPDPLGLLQTVQSKYSALTFFSAKSTTDMEMSGPSLQTKVEMHTSIQADSSGRMRRETTGAAGMLMVNDGKTIWTYFSQLNKYTKSSVSSQSGAQLAGMSAGVYPEFEHIATGVKDARVLRSETVQANGSTVPCWVVFVEYPETNKTGDASAQGAAAKGGNDMPTETEETKTLWVGQSDYLVYKYDDTATMTMPNETTPTHIKNTVKFDSVTIDQPIPENVFHFTPPPGATEMDESNFMPKHAPVKQP